MTTLSVCTITNDPGPRVAALLDLFRPVADEIVVAADARADEERLAHYAAVADRLQRMAIGNFERNLGWLHSQCSGDWILRIDGDEAPSAALVAQLGELIADRSVVQYMVPRRWLYQDADHWLDTVPWWPDYQIRLVRNDGTLRFSGRIHTSATPLRPARYLEAPIYHLDLLVNSVDARRAKAEGYERRLPGLEAPGGGPINEAFYFPEGRAGLTLATVPGEDRAGIAGVLDAPVRDVPPPDRLPPVVPPAEAEAHFPGRTVLASAYSARIECIERDIRMQAGERRPVHVRIANDGTESWPWDADLGPPIRASYRLYGPTGAVVVSDGPRTAFPCSVGPGATAVVPLDVFAPMVPGRYELGVDVVHEGVRWFDCDSRFSLEVVPVPGWPDVAVPPPVSRARSIATRLRRRPGRSFPKLIHRVWLGDAPLPEEARRFGEGWQHHHPEWELRLWGDGDVNREGLVSGADLARCRSEAEMSNLVRYAVLARFGGIYIDTDVECLQPFDELARRSPAFAGREVGDRVGTAVLGSRPGHPLFESLLAASRAAAGMSINSVEANGPGLLTLMVAGRDDIELLQPAAFYPYLWNDRHRRAERFERAYCVHHWDLSWPRGG